MNIGFLNEPGVRYRNFFIPRVEKNLQKLAHGMQGFTSQGLILRFFTTRAEGWRNFYTWHQRPFGNCIPVRVNQAIFCCHLTIFFDARTILKWIFDTHAVFFNKKFQKNSKSSVKTIDVKWFLHGGSCGNQISFQ